MKKSIILISLILVAYSVLFFNFEAREAMADTYNNLPGVDLDINSIQRIITGIACWTMSTILAVMVIALIVAGVRFYIGGAIGDVASAKKNLLWVLIGITVILGTNVIIATIAYSLGADYRSYIPLSCTNVSTNTTYEL